MKDSLKPENISFVEFETNRDAYESLVPSKLHALEDLRLHQIPELLEQRKTQGEAFLERNELSNLMEWKLYVVSSIVVAFQVQFVASDVFH